MSDLLLEIEALLELKPGTLSSTPPVSESQAGAQSSSAKVKVQAGLEQANGQEEAQTSSAQAEQLAIQCPVCKKDHFYDLSSPYRPFCSQRCQLIDFGVWAEGGYGIDVPPETDQEVEQLVSALERKYGLDQ